MRKITFNREQMGHLFDLTLLDLSDATGQAISEFFQHYMKDLCTQSLYNKYCGELSLNPKYSYLGFKKLKINQTKIYLKHNFCLFY